MTRVKSSSVKRYFHKKILLNTKGFIGRRKNVYTIAYRAYIKSLIHSTRDKLKNKSRSRSNNISIISINLISYKIMYSRFIYLIKINSIILNRKILSILFSNKLYNKVIIQLLELLGC